MLNRKPRQIEQVSRTPRLFEIDDPSQVKGAANELMNEEALVVVELARLSVPQQAAARAFLDGVAYALHLSSQKLTETRFEYRNGGKSANISR